MFPSLHAFLHPQHTLKKAEVNFLNPIKERNKDGMGYKQIHF